MIVELKSESSVAKIDSRGAELISLQDMRGTEYIWQRDPKYWNRCSPLLFPIVGNLREGRTIIDGKEYRMDKHGFCRDAAFQVLAQTDNSVVFSYSYNEETLKVYPYRFSLSLAYSLEGNRLSIQYSFLNMGEGPMDFCFGAHPAFNVPIGGGSFEDVCLEFNRPETEGSPVYDFENRQFNMENRVRHLNNETRLMLNYRLFDNDAILFDKPASDSVKLYSVKTGKGVEVGFGDFDYVAFWTPIQAEAPFVCIEPWCGMAACSDEGDEYAKKRGIKHLEPGEQKDFNLTVSIF